MRSILFAAIMSSVCVGLEVEPIQVRDTPIQVKHVKGARVNAIYAQVVGGKIAWRTLPDKHFLRGDEMTVMVAPPGEYMVTVGGSKIVKVLEDGEPPIPDPFEGEEEDDDQQPEPDGDKIKAKWAIWVEEQDDRQLHAEATAVMNDLGLRDKLRDRDIAIRIYDDDQAAAAQYLPIIEKARAQNKVDSLPVWILLAGDGKNYLVVPAPKTLSQSESILRKYVR